MSFTRRPGSGCPHLTSRREDRHIRLAEGHFRSRRPLRVLPLTPTHQHLRLERCRARGNWTAAEWNQVVFSDESRFNLSSDDNRVCVWSPRCEHLNPTFALKRHTASQLPARSPDLSPIEHIWDHLGRKRRISRIFCKDLLLAPGNRSNETHDIERRTWQRQRREGSERGEKGKRWQKTWSDKGKTAGRCRRAVSPLVRLVEERWEAPDFPQGALPQNWGETELNRSVTCMVLKATDNDRCHLVLRHDEFCGPLSSLR
ncbi:transposable element Tcb2 transposase [Trichonephila clavipes]|nr:transposable element Tcb2 transposase [Trichonephila clavipes]